MAPILLLGLGFLLTPTAATTPSTPSTSRLRSPSTPSTSRLRSPPHDDPDPHVVTLAPCSPLPVLTNCSAVPEALARNMAACTHISFQPGGYGQEATSASLRFSLEPKDAVPKAAGAGAAAGAGGGGGALTMVLLLGSVFYFPSMEAMYSFMQPKVRAAMEGNGLYDPTVDGPCAMANATNTTSAGAAAAAWPVEGEGARSTSAAAWAGMAEQEQGAGGFVAAAAAWAGMEQGPGSVARSRRAGRRWLQGGGGTNDTDLPSCADVLEAFNAEGGGMGEDAETYVHLYACNITAGGGNEKVHHQLSFDGLLGDFPYTYFMFLNIGPGPQNQTILYTAAFSPSYLPASTKLPQPLFAFLLLAAAVYFVVFCRYVSNPALDWVSSTRWGKRCLRGSRC